jgi:hypothetical protein
VPGERRSPDGVPFGDADPEDARGNIGDEKLREGFLSAAQVRRVLAHD